MSHHFIAEILKYMHDLKKTRINLTNFIRNKKKYVIHLMFIYVCWFAYARKGPYFGK